MKEAGTSSIRREENWSSRRVEEFYRRWKAPVFTFFCLYLGDQHLAGDATSRAFLSYYRQHRELEGNQLPVPLIGAVLAEACRLASLRSGHAVVPRAADHGQPLTDAILDLAGDERAVFILRTVLDMDAAPISAATGWPPERVHQLWRGALRRLSAALHAGGMSGVTPAGLHTATRHPESAATAAERERAIRRQDDDHSLWAGAARRMSEP